MPGFKGCGEQVRPKGLDTPEGADELHDQGDDDRAGDTDGGVSRPHGEQQAQTGAGDQWWCHRGPTQGDQIEGAAGLDELTRQPGEGLVADDQQTGRNGRNGQ